MYNLKDDKSQKKIVIKIVKYIEKRISLFKVRKILYLTTKNCEEKVKKKKQKIKGNKKQKEVNTKVKKK